GPNGLWPAHPDEEGELPFNKSLYHGATGTLWSLCRLSAQLNRELPFDPVKFVARIYQDYLATPDTGSVVPSYLLGECGILSLSQKLAPCQATLSRLRECVQGNTENPVNEALWGCPGTMLPALRFGQIDLYLKSAAYLYEHWLQNSFGSWT